MNKNQKGFILSTEIVIFILFISLILPFVVQYFIGGRADERRAVIDEMQILSIAAQNYYSELNTFPDQHNACISALTTMINATNSFITGVDNVSPWGTSYGFSCTPNLFNISVALDDDNASIVANRLPATLKNGTTVTMAVPIPSYMPALSSFLSQNASGSFNARGKNIINVKDIELSGSSTTLSGVIAKQANYDIVANGEPVNKPICPEDLEPQIYLSLVGLVATNGKLPYPNPPYVLSQNSLRWTVGIDVYTEDGLGVATTGTYALAITNCS